MVTIKNEEDAWQSLERLVRKEHINSIVFDKWPVFNLTVKGEEWDGTIPTRLLQPLIEFQRNINRIYVHIIHKNNNIRLLSDREREELELTVKVQKGSSSYDIILFDKLTKIVEEGVNNMTGSEILIFLIVATLAIAGVSIFKSWLSHKEKIDIKSSSLDISKEETRRLQIFSEIQKNISAPSMKVIELILENQRDIVKSIKDADGAKLNDLEFNRNSIEKLSRYKTGKHRKEQIEEEFIVIENKVLSNNEHNLKLKNISNGNVITAVLPSGIEESKKELLMKSEWGKNHIFVRLETTYKNDIFESATIIDVHT